MGVRRVPKPKCEEHWCPIEEALGSIGGMWKVIIIRELLTGVKRYGPISDTGVTSAAVPHRNTSSPK